MKKFYRRATCFLALLLCVLTLAPAFSQAALASEGRNVTADFEVYAPRELVISIDANGVVTPPAGEAARIYNASMLRDVQVTNISVVARNGWAAQSWDFDFDSAPENTRVFGLSMRGDALGLDGSLALTPANWVVEKNNYLPLDFDVKLAKQTVARSDEIIATVSFTFDWADSDTPGFGETGDDDLDLRPGKQFNILFENRDGGTIADMTPRQTNRYGVVPSLPVVTVDSQHIFSHYEDAAGNAVFAGDVLTSDVVLHPVFSSVGRRANYKVGAQGGAGWFLQLFEAFCINTFWGANVLMGWFGWAVGGSELPGLGALAKNPRLINTCWISGTITCEWPAAVVPQEVREDGGSRL